MTTTNRTSIIPFRHPWDGEDKIRLIIQHAITSPGGVSVAYAQPLTMKIRQPDEDGMPAPVAISLEPEEGQQLMDRLWECGLRPTQGKGSAGQLSATEAHLKDMRELVFRFMTVHAASIQMPNRPGA